MTTTSQNNDEMRLFVRQVNFSSNSRRLCASASGRHEHTLTESVIFIRFISCRDLNGSGRCQSGSCSAVTNLGREAGGQPSQESELKPQLRTDSLTRLIFPLVSPLRHDSSHSEAKICNTGKKSGRFRNKDE